LTKDKGCKNEPLIKSPWRQVCGCIFFVVLFVIYFTYSIISGQSFQLSLSFETLVIVMYLIFFALLFFLPQNVIDWIASKYCSVEVSTPKKEIPTERAESDIPTDRVE
jgi:hypothetical protein